MKTTEIREKAIRLVEKIGRRGTVVICAVILVGVAVLLNLLLFDGDDSRRDDLAVDLDALSEGDELIMDDEALLVERFKIEDGAAKILLMADGAVLENEELQIFWQKNDDEEDTWNTVAEGIAYLVVEAEEVELYRVICVRIAENGESKLYCAAVAVPDEGVDDALTESGSTEATEPEGTVTKPADGQENEENSRTEDNIGETTPAVPGNAADGE